MISRPNPRRCSPTSRSRLLTRLCHQPCTLHARAPYAPNVPDANTRISALTCGSRRGDRSGAAPRFRRQLYGPVHAKCVVRPVGTGRDRGGVRGQMPSDGRMRGVHMVPACRLCASASGYRSFSGRGGLRVLFERFFCRAFPFDDFLLFDDRMPDQMQSCH